MKRKLRQFSAAVLSLVMAVTLVPDLSAKAQEAPGKYSFLNNFSLGYTNSVVAYKNGRQVSLQEAGVKTYPGERDNPFEAQVNQSWDTPNLKLSMPVKYTTNDGKAHDIESMLTNFDFVADPTAIDNSEVDGKIYVYGTTEGFSYENGKMVGNKYANHSLTILSSPDMVNWTDEGFMDTRNLTNLRSDAPNKVRTGFTGGNTWAPSGLMIDGDGDGDKEYYIFYTNGGEVGYVMSDTPTGPWKDPLNRSLCGKFLPNCGDCENCFDPGVLADDKGNAYVYFGGLSRSSGRVVKIKFQKGTGEVSTDGNPVKLATHAFFEDNEINQFNGKYYYSYCSDWGGQAHTKSVSICCYVSSDPMNICFTPDNNNPFKTYTDNQGVYHHFLGTILDNPSSIYGQTYNNHHHMQEFKGKFYIFYHSTVLNNSIHRVSCLYRNLHVDEIQVDKNSDKITVNPSYEGAKQTDSFDPYFDFEGNEKFINATTTSYSAGVKSTIDDDMVENSNNGSPMVLDCIDTGDWTKIQGVDFSDKNPIDFEATLNSNTENGAIEVFIDSPTEPSNMIASLPLEKTSGYETLKCDIDSDMASGEHDVYFVFRGSGYKVSSWKFALEKPPVPEATPNKQATPTPEVTPAPTPKKQEEVVNVIVEEPKTEETVGNYVYKINYANGSVALKGLVNKNVSSAVIQPSVTIDSVRYSVTEIDSSVFSNNKTLKKVVIGSKVRNIPAKAFYKCNSLKKVIVKSKVLKYVGKKAFKGTAPKLVIKVPKKKFKAYKKLFKRKGQSKKAKIKK